MKEEVDIWKKVGKDNSFEIPEGYFENLTSEVMNKIPEKEQLVSKAKEPTRWDRVKPLFYMAAMFIGAALIIRVAMYYEPTSSENEPILAETGEVDSESDQYINAVVDGSMMDDYSLYVYLTEANLE